MKKYTVVAGQCLSDVALMVYGDISGLSLLVKDNGFLGPTDRIYEGQILLYRPDAINVRQKLFLQDYPAIATIKEADNPSGIGFWQIEEYVVQPLNLTWQFVGFHVIEGVYNLSVQIIQIGLFHLKVTNTTSGTVFYNDYYNFDGNGYLLPLTESGSYEIILGNLTHTVVYTL